MFISLILAIYAIYIPYLIITKIKRHFTKVHFEGKTVWITGASSGLGEALAYEMSRLGARLILSARNIKQLQIVKSKCHNSQMVDVLELDQTDPIQTYNQACIFLKTNKHPIDILINNAGVGMNASVLDGTLEHDIQIMNINVMSQIALTRSILPYMIKRKQGQIAVISSVQGKLGLPKKSTYAASKHAIQGYFDCLRFELSNQNISVSLILPAYVRSQIRVNALVKGKQPQDEPKECMAANVFAEKVAKGLFFKDGEILILNSFKQRIAIWMRNLFPDLVYYVMRKMYSKEIQAK